MLNVFAITWAVSNKSIVSLIVSIKTEHVSAIKIQRLSTRKTSTQEGIYTAWLRPRSMETGSESPYSTSELVESESPRAGLIHSWAAHLIENCILTFRVATRLVGANFWAQLQSISACKWILGVKGTVHPGKKPSCSSFFPCGCSDNYASSSCHSGV